MKDIIILGGGLSGISTAYFLQDKAEIRSITILEKEERAGGLCRSIKTGDYVYDIGPHILFSKDKEMLQLLLDVLENRNDLRRSNQIYYKGRHIQYPFENDLSKLPEEELRYCIQSFNHNPYEEYEAENMLQFFLKTFGEGITNTYLRPYNEKIWKYDPSFMNTSMVDRIPKPTKEEIQRSAAGETIEGYLHQLYFHYPANGGIEAVPQGFLKRLNSEKCRIEINQAVNRVKKEDEKYLVFTENGESFCADTIISTIPVPLLACSYESCPEEIAQCAGNLRYNSIMIAFIKTPYDICGDHFTFTIPDSEVIFHRISKMDFLGNAYHHGDEATFMAEITYRKNDYIDTLSGEELLRKICSGMQQIGFAKEAGDVQLIDLTRHEYAYVIYDLHHKRNMEQIRNFFANENIILNGRFGNFEYWNMDRILRESLEISRRFS